MPTIIIVDVDSKVFAEDLFISLFHSFIKSIPIGEEVCLWQNSNQLSATENLTFSLSGTALITKLKVIPLVQPLDKLFCKLETRSSFGLTVVLLTSDQKRIDLEFSPNSTPFFKRAFNVCSEGIRESLLAFAKMHYEPTICRVCVGSLYCRFVCFPSFKALGSEYTKGVGIASEWEITALNPEPLADSCCTLLKFKIELLDKESPLAKFIALGQHLTCQDKCGNKGRISVSSCGRYLEFSLSEFFALADSGKGNSNLSFVYGSGNGEFPFWNQETIDDLNGECLKYAQEFNATKFLESVLRLENLVSMYKTIDVLDTLEEELQLNGADDKYVEIVNDIKIRMLQE